MLFIADKLFLGLILLLSSPAAVVLADLHVLGVFFIYALFSVRLVGSDCLFLKSLGYGFAAAPILFFVEVDGGAMG